MYSNLQQGSISSCAGLSSSSRSSLLNYLSCTVCYSTGFAPYLRVPNFQCALCAPYFCVPDFLCTPNSLWVLWKPVSGAIVDSYCTPIIMVVRHFSCIFPHGEMYFQSNAVMCLLRQETCGYVQQDEHEHENEIPTEGYGPKSNKSLESSGPLRNSELSWIMLVIAYPTCHRVQQT